jgi:hypothetical protein
MHHQFGLDNGHFGLMLQQPKKELIWKMSRLLITLVVYNFMASLIDVKLVKSPIWVEIAPKWPIHPDIIHFDAEMGNFCQDKI